jgi:hypothetical protein
VVDKIYHLQKGIKMSIDHSKIISEYQAGMSMPKIAAQYCVSRQRIQQILKKYDISREDGGAYIRGKETKSLQVEKRNSRYLNRIGCTFGEYQAIPQAARKAYREQRRNAATRDIGWAFTLYTWWVVWKESGKWGQRGRGFGYVMARKEDVGVYSPDNVYICTSQQNMRDYYKTDLYKTRKKTVAQKKELCL